MSFPTDFFSPPTRKIWFDRTPELGPGSPVLELRPKIEALQGEDFLPKGSTLADACLAGFWLWFDFLEESHTLSQEISGPTGAFWHAIMHRREPDPFNSKYWFRQVGAHPVLETLAEQSLELGYRYTSPFDFVDFVEKVRNTGSEKEELAKQVQKLEWCLLMKWCVNEAS